MSGLLTIEAGVLDRIEPGVAPSRPRVIEPICRRADELVARGPWTYPRQCSRLVVASNDAMRA